MRETRICVLIVLTTFAASFALADIPVDGGINWLNAHQNANGSWGSVADLTPRDTARGLIAENTAASFGSGVVSGGLINSAYGWLNLQPLAANQFLAEQALALKAGNLDTAAVLARLSQQRSLAADFGGFAGHEGDTYDSALALQAFAVQPQTYASDITALVTSLITRQNGDGGWGINQGFDSNPLITAEVLIALASLKAQTVSPAVIAAAQAYLGTQWRTDGSFGGTPLITSVALRGLLLSSYSDLNKLIAAYNYIGNTRQADGSWGGDAYVTARAVEARTMNKPNFVLTSVTLAPTTVTEGGNVVATVKISNNGIASGVVAAFIRQDVDSGFLLASSAQQQINPGQTLTFTATFAATNMAGRVTLFAVADPRTAEVRSDDNSQSVTLTVNGKADLQIFPSDITTSPQQLQPAQPSQIMVTVHNGGESDVAGGAVALYDDVGTAETLLQKVTFGAIAAGGAQIITIPASFSPGVHTLKAVADPDGQVDEKSETNNTATKTFTVNPGISVDFRILPSSFSVSNPRPAAGETITISALVDNTGTDSAESTIAFYDGPPGLGAKLIAALPLSIAPQSSQQVQTTYVVTADSRVIYAVADPDNLTPEPDESNNAAYATLTDQFVDLVLQRDSFVMPKTTLSIGQSVTARVVVRNNGLLPATHAEVVVYDDLPQSGGVVVLDTFVDIPAMGKVVVPATWTVRHGQRFGVAQVNPTRAIFEPDYSNNRTQKFYYAAGNYVDDIAFSNLNASQVVVNATDLTVSGILAFTVNENQLATKPVPYVITVFDDVDGDQAYNPDVDVTLGSTAIDPRDNGFQNITIALQGRVRFVPPRLMMYLDSTNAIPETHEDNNLIDIYGFCATSGGISFNPQVKWSTVNGTRMLAPVARVLDVNGDDVIDNNDPVMLVQTNAGRIALRRNNGDLVWVKDLDSRGRQISPVIADLDGDGKPEILAHTNANGCNHCLVALNAADGSVKWTSPELEIDPGWFAFPGTYSYAGAPAVADLDGDGKPEVICGRSVLNGANGTIKWVGTGGRGRAFNPADQSLYIDQFPDQEAPIAVDLDNDGRLEVVAGNTAYRADGTILWQRADIPDGYAAPAYLTAQGPPKICIVSLGNLYVLNADGTNFWAAPKAIPGGAALGGAPTVYTQGDVFVGVAGDKQYSAWRVSNGQQMFSITINSDTSFLAKSTNAAAAVRFFGGFDLIYPGRDRLLFFDAINGSIHYTEPFSTSPFYPGSPTVADLDEDGFVDLVVGGDNNLRVFTNPTWNGAPSVYNEFAYHISNVSSDAATIPAHEMLSTLGYRLNTWFGPGVLLLPNLAVCYPRIDDSHFPQSVTLVVRVGNNGLASTPAVPVRFYSSATTTPVLLGTVNSHPIAPGAYEDVSFVYNNPPAGVIKFYAVGDETNTIRQCRATTSRSPEATRQLAVDIAVPLSNAISVSDPQPRPGDVITITATAALSGAIDPNVVRAQFFLSDPAAGGTAISPLLPVSLEQAGGSGIFAAFSWSVSAPSGPQTIYAFFDPANAISETNEANNKASYALTVSTSDPIRKISAALTLTPPAAESGTPVAVQALIQNIGNVPLSDVTLRYSVTGGAVSAGGSGTATVSTLPKNNLASVSLGTFTPAANATYIVTLAADDPSLTIVAAPQSIQIGPFASASFTAVPSRVPTSNPIVQLHTRVSRTNTIVVPDDPLVPILTSHLQTAATSLSTSMVDQLKSVPCLQCHVTPWALSGLENARRVPGIVSDETTMLDIFRRMTSFITGDGHVWASTATYGIDKTTALGAIGLAAYHDAEEVQEPLRRVLEQRLVRQNSDGSFGCEGGCFQFDAFPNSASWDNSETHTWMTIREMGRGYDLMQDPRYTASIDKAVGWCLNWSGGSAANPAPAARVAMALHDALPYLTNPSTINAARAKMTALAQFVRSVQNGDGSFSTSTSRTPAIATAQAIQAMMATGTPLSDPALRSALLWLVNNQEQGGIWTDHCCAWGRKVDVTQWAMSAISGALLIAPSLDVDLHVTIPSSADLTTATPPAETATSVTGGTALSWRFESVTAAGSDLYFNLRLNGLQNQETRAVATAASIHYKDPYSGNDVDRPITVPTVTGVALVGVAVTTDAATYQPNSNVAVNEIITNAAGSSLTNDVVIRDSAGTTVATLAAAEPLAELPQSAFIGWHYAIAATAQVSTAGVNRTVSFPIDFAARLASIGATGTFDRNSIRVTADAAPSAELPFFWMATDTHTASGYLVIPVPDSIAAGGSYPLHITFDTLENGVKPVSTFDRIALLNGQGIGSSYNQMDLSHSNLDSSQPTGITPFQPPFTVTAERSTTLNYQLVGTFPTPDWITFWTGAFWAPVTGTYQFLLGSTGGSWLDIDGTQLINNSGRHDLRELTASRTLSAGFHTIKITRFNYSINNNFYLKWAPPSSTLQVMKAEQLFTSRPVDQTAPLAVSAIALGAATRSYVWSTGASPAGPYTAVATVRDSGVFVANGSASFTIAAAASVAVSVATDKAAYDNGQTAHLTASVQYTTGSVPLTGAKATVSVVDAAGVTKSSATTNLPSLQPSGTATARLDWAVGNASPGNYTSKVVVVDAGGAQLATASAPFRVRSTAENGAGITGTISSAATVPAGNPLSISVSITNGGNAAITDAPFAVNIVDPSTQAVPVTVPFSATVAAGATATQQLTAPTTALAQQHYSLVLTSLITGTAVLIATAGFDIAAPRPQLSASISLGSTAVDPGDTLHATADISYLSGPASLAGLTATFTVAGTSSVKTLPDLTPGQTTSTAFDFVVGSTAPGTYTLTVTVKDASNAVLTSQTATFTVRSTADTGKGISGTIATPASVAHGDPLPINVAIIEGGNAALTNAPFAVQIGSTSLPFTATVAIGATYSTLLTAQTSALAPGTYTAVLVSLITGTPVPLASATFTVAPRAATLNATLNSDKNAYDVGETAHITGTISYASGDVALTDLQAVIVVAGQTSTTAIASLGPGQSANVAYDWPVGATPPGTYTATLTVKDATRTYATQSVTVNVRSTSSTGAGVTGTIATSATVAHNDPLPINVYITDGGNAALTNAPFAVQIGSTTLPFAVGVAIGATYSTSLTAQTSALVPGTYTAALVSLITGAPVTLASTTFQVAPQQAVLTATLTSDKSAYDAGDVAHISGTVSYPSGDVPVTNAEAIISVGGQTSTTPIASLAPGASVNVPYDWSVGTTAPGTYTVALTVRDATRTYVTTSIAVTVRSTAATGKGVTGTLTAPTSANVGDAVSVDVSLTNSGNADLVNAAYALQISDATTHAVVDTIPFTASVATGRTFQIQLTWPTAQRAPQTYSIEVVSRVADPFVLATRTIELKSALADVALDVALGGPPRVLVWADCMAGNSGGSCMPVAPANLTQTLTNAGLPWKVAGDQYSFMAALRTGGYAAAIIHQPGQAEPKIAGEYLEDVRAGFGLLFIDSDPNAMPKLEPALGVFFRGKRNATSTMLDVLASPFTAAAQLAMNGDGVKIDLNGAAAAAKVLATGEPAIAYNALAAGRTAVISFDTERTPSADVAKLLVAVVKWNARPPSHDARSVVAVTVHVTVPPGSPFNGAVSVTVPPELTVVDASPAFAAGTTAWNVSVLGGQSVDLVVWLRLPSAIGSSNVTIGAAVASQPPSATKTLPISVTADRAAIESSLSNRLTALATAVPQGDRHALDEAQAQLAALRVANPADAAGTLAVIDRVMALIGDLQSISINTGAARADADRLLVYWQSKAGG